MKLKWGLAETKMKILETKRWNEMRLAKPETEWNETGKTKKSRAKSHKKKRYEDPNEEKKIQAYQTRSKT